MELLGSDNGDDRSMKRSLTSSDQCSSESLTAVRLIFENFHHHSPVVYILAADLLPEAAAASGLASTNLGRRAATLGQAWSTMAHAPGWQLLTGRHDKLKPPLQR